MRKLDGVPTASPTISGKIVALRQPHSATLRERKAGKAEEMCAFPTTPEAPQWRGPSALCESLRLRLGNGDYVVRRRYGKHAGGERRRPP
ncbi:MAG: hypothetical protein HY360_18140 [Verrucomicrobia bacterium]|nr:hypothetical protein [Verrucomicrobiota bacterium]